MSRKLRALPAIVVLSFAFSAAACANAVGPRETQTADTSGPNVARAADTSGPNVSRNGASISR
jgi:hypothetical protein